MLQVQPVSRRKLQLVGVTAMLVACKYEEMYAPEVGDFAYITDNAFTKSQILEMEQVVLRSLNFQLGRPLPLHFLRRASKVANVSSLIGTVTELQYLFIRLTWLHKELQLGLTFLPLQHLKLINQQNVPEVLSGSIYF